MKKIGLSIPWDYLADNIVRADAEIFKQNFGSAPELLKFLKNLGINHIELRHRNLDISQNDMKLVFKILLEFNFNITIHGDNPIMDDTWNIDDVFPWLKSYNEVYLNTKKIINVTFHPFTGSGSETEYKQQTIEFIKRLDNLITENNLLITLALENQRSKKISDPGKSFTGVEEMTKKINRKNVGICWDFGHGYANYLNDSTIYPLAPHNEFTAAATHTHIHDLGPTGKTHWVFKENKVPLADYVSQLKQTGYKGIYNLELSFDRFATEENIPDLLKDTIEKLRKMI